MACQARGMHGSCACTQHPEAGKRGLDRPWAFTLCMMYIAVTVNCFGRDVIRNRGGAMQYANEPDPPAPSPRRCFALGQATARILKDSPWRVVLMASSSWSHAFLTAKHHLLYPDLEADRVLLEQ